MNEIVEKNLVKIKGTKPGEMKYTLSHESMGGNAGNWKGLPCMAANFYYSKWTGEIIIFGNPQEVHPEIKENNPIGTIIVALNLKKGKDRIVNLIIEHKLSDKAKKNLDETIKVYNEKYGFKEG